MNFATKAGAKVNKVFFSTNISTKMFQFFFTCFIKSLLIKQ